MASPLTWIFQLTDKMSGPAKTIAGSLGTVGEAAKSAGESLLHIAEGVGLERLAEKAFEVGQEFVKDIFHAREFANQTRAAFEVMTGSKSEAAEMFEGIERFAVGVGLPLEQVANTFKQLQLAGIARKDMDAIANAAADLSQLKGGSIESWAETFTRIHERGELTARVLSQLPVSAEELGRVFGRNVKNVSQLEASFKALPVSGDQAIKGILLALQSKTGGEVGGFSKRIADDFSHTIESIKIQIESLFEGTGDERNPILDMLHAVRDGLAGPLMVQIKAGISSLMEGLGVISGPDGMKSFLESVRNGTVLGEGFKDVMHGIGVALRFVADTAGVVAKAFNFVGEAIGDSAASIVEMVGLGPEVHYKNTAAGRPEYVPPEYIAPAPKSTGLFGGMIPGFAEGARVTGPTLAMIGEGGEPENIIPDSKMGRGGTIQLHVEQHFNVSGHQGMDVKELAQQMHHLALGDFQGALDTLAQQFGAA